MAVANRSLASPQPKATTELRLRPILLLVAAAIVIIGLLRIVQTSQATTAGFAVQTLQQGKLELETSVSQLEAQVASLSSLARIEREARRLGLVAPRAESTIVVNAAWPAAGEDLLPTRFALAGSEDAEENGRVDQSAWWQDLLKLLPFY